MMKSLSAEHAWQAFNAEKQGLTSHDLDVSESQIRRCC